MLAAGTVIDRYVVEKLLGEGGMASVYRVRHRTLASTHALKVLKFEVRGLTERLVQEGQVQASLRHPNIVAVTDVVEVDGKPGLVMEYVDGPSLDQWMRGRTPTLEETEGLFLGMLAGVARAHREGLVHRDLKPGNVLLQITDEGVIPKVADFGLVKALTGEGDMITPGANQTRSGMAMGTPAYMAPEQVRDASNVDRRADIFALGCILYELVCGVPPFDGPDPLSIFGRLARGAYVPPAELVPTLPERFRRAIAGCLELERERRIADCGSLRALFTGSEDSVTDSVRAVAIADLKPRHPTVTNTLEPGGHGRPSGSDTFAADGIAGLTMTPEFLQGGDSSPPRVTRAEVATGRDTSGGPPPSVAPQSPSAASGGRPWLMAGCAMMAGMVAVLAVTALGLGWIGAQGQGANDGPRRERSGTRAREMAPPPESKAAAAPAAAAPGGAEPAAEEPSMPAPADAAPAAGEPVPPAAGEPDASPATAASETPAPELSASSKPAKPPDASGTSERPPSESRFQVEGDATEVWLEGPTGRVKPGPAAPGTYALKASFGGDTISQGTVTVRPKETLRVRCSASFKICRAE